MEHVGLATGQILVLELELVEVVCIVMQLEVGRILVLVLVLGLVLGLRLWLVEVVRIVVRLARRQSRRMRKFGVDHNKHSLYTGEAAT